MNYNLDNVLNALDLLTIDELEDVEQCLAEIKRKRHINAIHAAITAAIADGYAIGIVTDEILNQVHLDNTNIKGMRVVTIK